MLVLITKRIDTDVTKSSTPESLRHQCAHFLVIRFVVKCFCFDDIADLAHA